VRRFWVKQHELHVFGVLALHQHRLELPRQTYQLPPAQRSVTYRRIEHQERCFGGVCFWIVNSFLEVYCLLRELGSDVLEGRCRRCPQFECGSARTGAANGHSFCPITIESNQRRVLPSRVLAGVAVLASAAVLREDWVSQQRLMDAHALAPIIRIFGGDALSN